MRPEYRMTSLVLQSLGVALLLLSIALVPQSRALADTETAVCGGPNNCDYLTDEFQNICLTQDPCPDKCREPLPSTKIYCKCETAKALCKDCKCKRGHQGSTCGCY